MVKHPHEPFVLGVTMSVPSSLIPVGPSAPTEVRPIALSLDPLILKPLLENIVRTVVQELGTTQKQLIGGKLAVDESEAAAYLGLNSWQLRDLRREGRITHRRIVGNRVRYTVEDLNQYLADSMRRGT